MDLVPVEISPSIVSGIQSLSPHSRHPSQGRHKLRDARLADIEVDVPPLDFRGQRSAFAVTWNRTQPKRAEAEMIR